MNYTTQHEQNEPSRVGVRDGERGGDPSTSTFNCVPCLATETPRGWQKAKPHKAQRHSHVFSQKKSAAR